MTETQARDVTLPSLADMLKAEHARKIDMVIPAARMMSLDGDLSITGVDWQMDADGMTDPNGTYRPTRVCDEGLADKLGIPLQYMRTLRATRPDLVDANVNGWLHGYDDSVFDTDGLGIVPGPHYVGPDERTFLLRTFRPDDNGSLGVARALLSDRYGVFDNLDALIAALAGVKAAGVDVVVDSADLTDRRMVVKVVAPEVRMLAERLLKSYRNPFGDEFDRWRQVADREGLGYGGEEPIIFAGLRISNSETGGGAFQIVPEFKIKVCRNGLVITKDAMRSVHLGGKMDEGVIRWSQETATKTAELVSARTADAVRTFLDVDYMESVIADIEDDAEKPVNKPAEEIKVIGKKLTFTDTQIDGILDHFIRGGQMTRGGVMNAITSYSQTVENADVAYDLEAKALSALTV